MSAVKIRAALKFGVDTVLVPAFHAREAKEGLTKEELKKVAFVKDMLDVLCHGIEGFEVPKEAKKELTLQSKTHLSKRYNTSPTGGCGAILQVQTFAGGGRAECSRAASGWGCARG